MTQPSDEQPSAESGRSEQPSYPPAVDPFAVGPVDSPTAAQPVVPLPPAAPVPTVTPDPILAPVADPFAAPAPATSAAEPAPVEPAPVEPAPAAPTLPESTSPEPSTAPEPTPVLPTPVLPTPAATPTYSTPLPPVTPAAPLPPVTPTMPLPPVPPAVPVPPAAEAPTAFTTPAVPATPTTEAPPAFSTPTAAYPTAAYPTPSGYQAPGQPTSAQPGYPATGQPTYPTAAYPMPGQPVSGQPGYPAGYPGQPAYPGAPMPGYPAGQFPGAPMPPAKKSRVPMIIGIVLGVLVLLCGAGGITTYFVLRNTEGVGAGTAKEATQSFLTAMYKNSDAAAAEKLVCEGARDGKEISDKVAQIKAEKAKLKSPSFTWETPKVTGEAGSEATAEVTVKLVTSDEKMSEQKLTLTLVKHEGWFVCEVK